MEIKLENYSSKKHNILIEENKITGINGNNKLDFVKLLSLNNLEEGNIYINNIKVTEDNIKVLRKRIGLVTNRETPFYINTVYDYVLDSIRRDNIIIKESNKRIRDAFKIVGMPIYYLERNYYSLSTSEKKIIDLMIVLIDNPTIIILNDFFQGIDLKIEKRIILLLRKIKEQYKKTIIISDDNADILYKYTDNMIFIKNNKIFYEGTTKETYTHVEYLKRSKFTIPDIVLFTSIAKKKKNVKIDYHNDIRDIIKDIYKHIKVG